MYVVLNGTDHEAVCTKLKTVFGIYSFSVAYKMEKNLELAKQAVLQIIENNDGNTFKINTKRSDKNFPEVLKKLIVKLQDMYFITLQKK